MEFFVVLLQSEKNKKHFVLENMEYEAKNT